MRSAISNLKLAVFLCALCVSAVNSQEPLRCTVNANGYVMDKAYKTRGWNLCPVTDLQIKPGEYPPELGTLQQAFLAAKEHHATGEVGTYFSASKCQPTVELTAYPRPSVACERFSPAELFPSGLCPTCKHMDFRLEATRKNFIALANAELAARGPGMVLLDNVFNRRTFAEYPVPFDLVCSVLAGLQAPGRVRIANIANQSWHWPDEEIAMLAQATEGSAWEMPWHPTVRTDAAKMRRQIDVYQRWLAGGEILVFMWGLAGTDPNAESAYAAALALMIAEPGQKAWVHWNFFQVDPPWALWREQLGAPQGPLSVLDGGIVKRTFAKGTLEVKPPNIATITLFPPASEPTVASPPKTLSQAVADGTQDIRISGSGTLSASLVLRNQTIIVAGGQTLTCGEGVNITCEFSQPGRQCVVLEDGAVRGCKLIGKWTGSAPQPEPDWKSFHGFACYGGNAALHSVMAEGFDDGFYAGPKTLADRAPCRFAVTGSAFRGNRRQGASITCGVGELKGCTFVGTKGKSPQAGLDVETDSDKDTIDVRITDCTSDGNWGNPYLVNLDRVGVASPPPKVVFASCKAVSVAHQWTDLRIAGAHEQPSGLPRATLPKGALIEWDGLKLLHVR